LVSSNFSLNSDGQQLLQYQQKKAITSPKVALKQQKPNQTGALVWYKGGKYQHCLNKKFNVLTLK
jgi:hypothetical protein